eukprot:gene11077-12245_t
MSTPLISNQSVTVQLPATDRVGKLKELLAEALKLQLHDYEVFHNGQKLQMDQSFQFHGIGGEGLVVLKVDITIAPLKRLEIGEFSVVIDSTSGNGNHGTADGCTQTGQTEDADQNAEFLAQSHKINETSILEEPIRRNLIQPFISEGDHTSLQSLAPILLIQNFLKVCEAEMRIPRDPRNWTPQQVCQFINWLVDELNIQGVEANQFRMNGIELCNLSKQDLSNHFPSNLVDVLWMYLETLKFATGNTINSQPQQINVNETPVSVKDTTIPIGNNQSDIPVSPPQTVQPDSGIPCDSDENKSQASMHSTHATGSSRTNSNSGQIQLWQFLLELLTDRGSQQLISWVGDKGAFKLNDPERVAQLWGERKNKPAMNYEKLSRALRYYYDGDMIHKVHGKRFVYKFVCDLKMLLGYSAAELARLVNETPMPSSLKDEPDCFVAISLNNVLNNVDSYTS